MFISVFDLFKIGIGPSSSHTMGPIVAGRRFLDLLRGGRPPEPGAGRLASVRVYLHGSLAFTGKGHATDRAVVLGLLDLAPDAIDPDAVEGMEAALAEGRMLQPLGLPPLAFDPAEDVVFDFVTPLGGHPNGMVFRAFGDRGHLYMEETYYSVGGGFVMSAAELESARSGAGDRRETEVPYPFGTARDLLDICKTSGLSMAEIQEANECALRSPEDLERGLERIEAAMLGCLERGMSQTGILPGGLSVRRRARAIAEKLEAETRLNSQQPHLANMWLSVYAMAVNEENAAGGRVVTAPTNGAAGVIPAVLKYYRDHCIGAERAGVRRYLLTAAAIGSLIKRNASISGAEVGCQGEVGSASSMAAAGLCAALGGTPEQVENAAEIALEHHLGKTCDPVGGLVQVPCIERNGLGAIKAVSAAGLALTGDGSHFMPLDNCIETMRQTGRDMSDKYKETSLGGLAVNLPEC